MFAAAGHPARLRATIEGGISATGRASNARNGTRPNGLGSLAI